MHLVPSTTGVNPLNGSDLFENPDGDGYDVNKDGFSHQTKCSSTILSIIYDTDFSGQPNVGWC